jgi:transglutaminase/protease-like cytokinesis protein 3
MTNNKIAQERKHLWKLYYRNSHFVHYNHNKYFSRHLPLFESNYIHSMNEFEKELAIRDELAELISYDWDALEDNTLYDAYTMSGALLRGKAVCEGYAKAFDFLLTLTGIESHYVTGDGFGVGGWGRHALVQSLLKFV